MQKYEEMRRVLEEDCRITLSLLEMEEMAAVQALDNLIETNYVLLKDIEVQLNEGMADSDIQPGDRVSLFISNWLDRSIVVDSMFYLNLPWIVGSVIIPS